MTTAVINKVCDAGCTAYDYSVNKALNFFFTATSPLGARKLGKLALSIFSNVEFYTGNKYLPDVVKAIKGGVELIDFGSTAVIGALLLNPLNSKNLDYKELESTLSKALPANKKSLESVMNAFKKEAKNITCRPKAQQILTKILLKQGICTAATDAEKLLGRVTIQAKSRPILKTTNFVLSLFCTIGSNLKTLDKLGVLKLATISAALGATKVFGFVAHLALDTTLGVVSCINNVVVIVFTSWNMIEASYPNKKLTEQENAECQEKIRQGWWVLAAEITDLASTALPLAFVSLNPPVVLTLGLIAKAVGFIAFCNVDQP